MRHRPEQAAAGCTKDIFGVGRGGGVDRDVLAPTFLSSAHTTFTQRTRPATSTCALEMNRASVMRLLMALIGGTVLLVSSALAQPGPPFKEGSGPRVKNAGPRGLGPKKGGPKIGEQAPDFELKFLASEKTFKLSANFGKRPTVLLFHSFT